MGATITSFYFLCFLLGVLVLYYVVPGRFQWLVLLASSIAYYLLSGNGLLIVYPLITGLIAYLGARMPRKRISLILCIILMLSPLFALKYINFIFNTINIFLPEPVLAGPSWAVPLGISFYTFSMLSYLIDVYNGIAECQTSLLKFLTYGIYFPTVLSGPIMKYRENASEFFVPHKLSYHSLAFGAQRILWGFFKVIVISERMRSIADTVFFFPDINSGLNNLVAVLAYTLELYTNFSGSMDIVLGISEMFGLKLPENFNTPFFSTSIAEFWRRWHITLGDWMKEYVFYPLLRSRLFTNMQKSAKEKFGKKAGKQLTTFTAMLVLWFTVGVWHGGDWKYVIGSGLLHWLYIVTGELTAPAFNRLYSKINIDPKARFLNVIRSIRTFILVSIGLTFFRAANIRAALTILRGIFVSGGAVESTFPGLDWIECVIAFVALIVLIVVSALQTKGSLRERIAKRPLLFRWILWYALLFFTILTGYYGPGFSAAEFIYQGF